MIPPHDAESVVVAKMRAAVAVASCVMPRVEPALKPYQPNHRMKVPSACNTLEWPSIGIGFGLPSRAQGQPPQTAREAPSSGSFMPVVMKRPWRGPMTNGTRRDQVRQRRRDQVRQRKRASPSSGILSGANKWRGGTWERW